MWLITSQVFGTCSQNSSILISPKSVWSVTLYKKISILEVIITDSGTVTYHIIRKHVCTCSNCLWYRQGWKGVDYKICTPLSACSSRWPLDRALDRFFLGFITLFCCFHFYFGWVMLNWYSINQWL